MECSSSHVNALSNINLQNRQQAKDKTRSAMLDLDFLDCPICVEPFTIPIFQCNNGHLACASCCPKLKNKCPACALPLGHNRCRAMESVLESIFVPCQNAKFGCTKNVSYGKESIHEKECIFSQCSCPELDCQYTGLYKDLFDHYSNTHIKGYGPYRLCDLSFQVRMNFSNKIVILRESARRLLFAVQCFRKSYGMHVTVSCIAPSALEVGEFSYDLSYTVDGHTVMYKSPEVKRILKVSFQTPHENFMLIPQSLLRGEKLEMELCIETKIISRRHKEFRLKVESRKPCPLMILKEQEV